MKIAVVGAGGFVGTRLIEHFHLAKDGPVSVTAVVRRPEGLALPARFAIETYIADPLDVDTMARAFSGCTAVIHCSMGDIT
ncbi:MAG TPA: NAD(P)H-binding protein, partial [Opitutus sp.]|nr:NAD(P)H-binding protein [Opitutus sp.]